MSDTQKEFEAWVKTSRFHDAELRKEWVCGKETGKYSHGPASFAWAAWEAALSRSAEPGLEAAKIKIREYEEMLSEVIIKSGEGVTQFEDGSGLDGDILRGSPSLREIVKHIMRDWNQCADNEEALTKRLKSRSPSTPQFEIRHHTCEFAMENDPPLMEEEPYDGALGDENGMWRKFLCPVCHDRCIIQFHDCASSSSAPEGTTAEPDCVCGLPFAVHRPYFGKDKTKPLNLEPKGYFCPEPAHSSRVRSYKPNRPKPTAPEGKEA